MAKDTPPFWPSFLREFIPGMIVVLTFGTLGLVYSDKIAAFVEYLQGLVG